MKKKKQRFFLFIISCFFVILSVYFRKEAVQSAKYAIQINETILDPWKEQIFSERDFNNLVVSIKIAEEDLYSEESGIFTYQYNQRGMEGERPIEVFVYQPDQTTVISQKAGVRITGAASRSAMRKSLRVIARDDYDEQCPEFTYELWGKRTTLDGSNQPIKEYSSFILHSMRLAMDATGIHNSVGYHLAKNAGIQDASPTTPAALYINGVYQGAYFLLPAKNDNAISELYHIEEKENIELLTVFEEEKTGSQSQPELWKEYTEFASFIQQADMNDPKTIEKIEAQLDVENCLKYYAVNLLLGNGDWMDNNLRVWRSKNTGLPYQDGKWRYYLFDLDWIGSFAELVSINFQTAVYSYENYNILPALLKNPEYLSKFKTILLQMINDSFYRESICSIIAEENAKMLPEITYDYQSEAFVTFLQYSINSKPPSEEDYITLADREKRVADFESHLLKTPAIILECMELYLP